MSEKSLLVDDICNQFEKLRWHDSKLKEFRLYEVANRDEVSIEILWVPVSGNDWTAGKVIFSNCTYLINDMDLDGKRLCADSIACGICEIDSELKHRLIREQFPLEPRHLDDFLHFNIHLIDPGGDIHIFAKSFEVL